MALPTTLFAAAAEHPCFSGVFDKGNRIQLHLAARLGPLDEIDFQCEDCLSFRMGCLASDLPPGVTHEQAAVVLTEHVRQVRGYALSVGGYHTAISGWLSAVYWAVAGLFVLHTDRGSGASKPPVDVLIQAMKAGLIRPSHPAMLDPQQYQTQEVFLSVVPPPTVTSVAALLASPHVAPTWKRDHKRVVFAEFLPVSRGQASAASNPAVVPAATPALATPATTAGAAKFGAPQPSAQAAKVAGQRCQECGEIVGERWLLTTRYIGCRCG